MHCRKLRYRYKMMMEVKELNFLTDDWRSGKVKRTMAQPCWKPATDIYETDGKIYLIIELAGVNPKDIDIALYENAIVIEGVRRLPPDEQEGLYQLAEIRQGAFRLELILPTAVDAENVGGGYEQGVLKIILQKV